ncbi:hypothetical protein KJ780_01765 [Candidatus Micrarchaeota archaeon]|nr:hypothetical protein [Candidatus Micrarchaeota archaeon]
MSINHRLVVKMTKTCDDLRPVSFRGRTFPEKSKKIMGLVCNRFVHTKFDRENGGPSERELVTPGKLVHVLGYGPNRSNLKSDTSELKNAITRDKEELSYDISANLRSSATKLAAGACAFFAGVFGSVPFFLTSVNTIGAGLSAFALGGLIFVISSIKTFRISYALSKAESAVNSFIKDLDSLLGNHPSA